MRKLQRIKIQSILFIVAIIFALNTANVFAQVASDNVSIDRIQLVSAQIKLLKNRLSQAQSELGNLQQDEPISQMALEKASKHLVDKAALDISVSKSNLESINIELTDTQQTTNWLEKNIQEIENQLNILNIFGLKFAPKERIKIKEYRSDLTYQNKLLALEKERTKYLQDLQNIASSILSQKTDRYNRLNALLKSRKMLHIKQQQVKDELAYQELQNHWLEQLNTLYAKLAKVDPAQEKTNYSAIERDIYYANENANFAYIQSLIARYKDQIQQMKLLVYKSNSISLLNEIGNQVLTLTKQINRLDGVLKNRLGLLDKHISYLVPKKKNDAEFQIYLKKLSALGRQYKIADNDLNKLNNNLLEFRKALDQELQTELSSRQGFPTIGIKTFLDIGKELLLVPALSFQVIKSLSTHVITAVEANGIMAWIGLALIEFSVLFTLFFLHKALKHLLSMPSQWRDQLNSKWISLQCLQRNLIDVVLIGNALAVLYFFAVPLPNFTFVLYLALVWLFCKVVLTISRICLVETAHNTGGHDVKLFRRLRWIVLVGGLITAVTVFVHQLPLIYELKTLCNNLFLFFLMIISILLLRSWDVIPNLILFRMEAHPYLQKSIRLMGILIPSILLTNSIIGLFGFVNLIMTVSWYEGIFIIVLIGYLILRGLLTDAMEQMSRMMIQYVNNGWLWTEAFLKPLDKVARITLFLFAWVVLFLLYGWDKRSPIVERLTRLLHYQLANILNTTITPLSIIELFVVISIFYWTAKWTREFVYRLLLSRTKDMGLRNSIAILSQYTVIIVAVFICLRVLGIDLRALTFVAASFAFGVGLGLRDLANNFASGFLLLLERPLRVGDIVNIGGYEGEVTHIGSRAVTIQTWDHMELMVPNAEIFNKSFTNWTARDNVVRSIAHIKISRYDNPHEVKVIIQNILSQHKNILKEPMPEVLLKEISDTLMEFELRYHVNIRQVKSRISVMSAVLMEIWDAFAQHGIKPPYPQHEVLLKNITPLLGFNEEKVVTETKNSI